MKREHYNQIFPTNSATESERILHSNQTIDIMNTSGISNSCQGPFLSFSSVSQHSIDLERLQEMLQKQRLKTSKLKKVIENQKKTIYQLNEQLTNDLYKKQKDNLTQKLKKQQEKVHKLKLKFQKEGKQENMSIQELKKEIARLANINSVQSQQLDQLSQSKTNLEVTIENMKLDIEKYKKRLEKLYKEYLILQRQSCSSITKFQRKVEGLTCENSRLKQRKSRSCSMQIDVQKESLVRQLMGILNLENLQDVIPQVKELKNTPVKLIQRITELVSQCSGIYKPTHQDVWKWIRRAMEGYVKFIQISKYLKQILSVNSQKEILKKVKGLIEKERVYSDLVTRTQKTIGASRAADAELEEALYLFANM